MPRNTIAALTVRILLISLALLTGALSAGAESDWSISATAAFPGGEPANRYIREVVSGIESEEGVGAPVTAAEFRALCDRAGPRADLKALNRYASPGSIRKQNFDHSIYAKRLMRDNRVEAGALFLREQREILRAAERRYGVARHDIVSILMWESGLGKITGDTRVFDILLAQLLYLEDAREAAVRELRINGTYDASLDATAKQRSERFAKLKRRAVSNLVSLLRVSKEKGQDPTAQRGSWAGAIGYPQFMPASLRYAVDGDGDGVIDLKHWPDAIFSVASYLSAHHYDQSYAGRKRGIHAYNPIDSYVHGVIRYADAIVRR